MRRHGRTCVDWRPTSSPLCLMLAAWYAFSVPRGLEGTSVVQNVASLEDSALDHTVNQQQVSLACRALALSNYSVIALTELLSPL